MLFGEVNLSPDMHDRVARPVESIQRCDVGLCENAHNDIFVFLLLHAENVALHNRSLSYLSMAGIVAKFCLSDLSIARVWQNAALNAQCLGYNVAKLLRKL